MAPEIGPPLLVIRLSSLGDVARLLPSLRSLKEGGIEADLTVEDRFAPLLDLFPLARKVIAYPRRRPGSALSHPLAWTAAMRRYLRELRSVRYTAALDLHGILRSALVARLSGAEETVGYAKGFGKEGSHRLYDRAVAPAAFPRISRFDRYAGTLKALGLPAPTEEPLSPRIPPGAAQEVADFLAARGISPGRYLFFFLGTSRAQAHKRWPPGRFRELSELVRERSGLVSLLGWGPDEQELLRAMESSPNLVPIPLWDLPRLLEVIRLAAGFVGADTGAMHLAALMGVPTVAVLGPTDPVVNRPFGNKSRVVYRAGIVRACSGDRCPHGDCMAAIEAGEVADALLDLLGAEEGGMRP
jgi:heptosyltransferase-1